MRKTLSVVLAAAALFGGAAISNGVANAYDYGTEYYNVDLCEGKRYDDYHHVDFKLCHISGKLPFNLGAHGIYAFVTGVADNVTDVTIPESLGGHDVIQIGGEIAQDGNPMMVLGAERLEYLKIEARESGVEGFKGTPVTVSENAFNGASNLKDVNLSGKLVIGKNAFNNCWTNIWKHDITGKKKYIFVKEYEGAFATDNVND